MLVRVGSSTENQSKDSQPFVDWKGLSEGDQVKIIQGAALGDGTSFKFEGSEALLLFDQGGLFFHGGVMRDAINPSLEITCKKAEVNPESAILLSITSSFGQANKISTEVGCSMTDFAAFMGGLVKKPTT